MRHLEYGLVCCTIALGLAALTALPVAAHRPDAAAPSAQRLELEVAPGGSLTVEADRIYLPPGAAAHAPLRLPPRLPPAGVDQRGRVQVALPLAGKERPATAEVWARGMITVTLPSGERLRLGDLVPRARITFERPDDTWRVIVEPLPASAALR